MNQIEQLQNEIATLKAKIEELETPNIFWLVDDPENGVGCIYDLISEFYDESTVGQILEFEVATRLPNIKVKVLGDDEDGSINLEYL